jgi:monoamine oxidase
VTEFGGEFINSTHADMLDLAREFGLKVFNRAESLASRLYPNTAFYFGGARRDPAELAQLLGPLAQQIATDAARLEQDPDTWLGAFDRLSVSAYLDRHAALIPQPWVRTLIETSIRTEFGSEPGQSSAIQLLYNLPTVDAEAVEVLGLSDEAYCIQGGNSRIIAALGQALGGRVHTGFALVAVRCVPGGAVRLDFRDGRTVIADQAIITIPFTVLRSVQIVADLPELLRRAISELDLGRNEKVLGGFARRAWQQADGFVGEAWTDLGFAEVWDGSQHQPEREDGALIFFLGAREVTAPKPGEGVAGQGQTFVARLETCLPGVQAAATGRYARTAWSEDPLVLGAYTSYRPGQVSTFGGLRWVESADLARRQEVRAGGLVFAGEHLSEAFFGYMNGGAQTGRLAAESVLRVAGEMDGASDP